jgi:G3E family GTPase
LRIFGLTAGRSFSEKVLYIYRKQLEEADLIVINKSDTVAAADLARLRETLAREYPHARLLDASARRGDGLDEWFHLLTSSEQVARRALEMDYDVYADGEARLGWLNATVQLERAAEFDANALLEHLARSIQANLTATAAEVAHLKITFSPDGGLNDIAVVNLVRSDFVPELSLRLDQPSTAGQLIVNVRAEAAPAALKAAVETAVAGLAPHAPGLVARIDHLEHFQPGRPQPTHRELSPA